MNRFSVLCAIFFLVLISAASAQEQIHRWKPVIINEDTKVWYDAAAVDTLSNSQFSIWVLQMHRPPLTSPVIKGDVYRSKTFFGLDLKTAKYAILRVVYYDLSNKEIFNFDYSSKLLSDDIRYTYPILEKSVIYSVIKDIFRKNGN